MPNATKSAVHILSTEEILAGCHGLSDELALTPAQAGVVLQTSTDQLQTMREAGGGPIYFKLGQGAKAPVRYELGELRKWRASMKASNTSSFQVSRFAGLADFLTTGGIEDHYLAALDPLGDIHDFWRSVRGGLDIVEVRWMRMDDMLGGLRKQANRHNGEREGDDMGSGIPIPEPDERPNGKRIL